MNDMTNPAEAASAAAPVPAPVAPKSSGKGCLFALLVFLVVCLAGAGFAFWWFTHGYRIPVTELSAPEEQVLEQKVTLLTQAKETPEVKLEQGVTITERELNGVISDQEQFREKLYFDLKPGGIEVRMNQQVPDDFPVMPGKKLRIKARVDIALVDSAMEARIRSVQVGGFSVPSAWMGDLKNKDFLSELFKDNAVLEAFARGLKEFEITEDGIHVVPNE